MVGSAGKPGSTFELARRGLRAVPRADPERAAREVQALAFFAAYTTLLPRGERLASVAGKRQLLDDIEQLRPASSARRNKRPRVSPHEEAEGQGMYGEPEGTHAGWAPGASVPGRASGAAVRGWPSGASGPGWGIGSNGTRVGGTAGANASRCGAGTSAPQRAAGASGRPSVLIEANLPSALIMRRKGKVSMSGSCKEPARSRAWNMLSCL